MGHPRHLKYANCAEALRHMDSWSSLHFDSTLRDPLLYVVDDSFDHAFGVEHREHIECSEHTSTMARPSSIRSSQLSVRRPSPHRLVRSSTA